MRKCSPMISSARSPLLRGPPAAPLPTRPRVPPPVPPLRVEHEDGVVLDRLHHQAKAFLALAQHFLVAPPLAEIARDLAEAAHFAIGIAQRGDHHVRPEEGPVLAHAPALVLEAAFARGDLELVLRPATVDRLLRVEGGEMAADDLVRLVALDALRAGIPGEDVAAGVEQEDGIVLHPLHDAAERIIDAFQFCLGRSGPCHAGCGKSSTIATNARRPLSSIDYKMLVAKAGIEPATHGFSVRCSTN